MQGLTNLRVPFLFRGCRSRNQHWRNSNIFCRVNQAGRAQNYWPASQSFGVPCPKWMSCKCAFKCPQIKPGDTYGFPRLPKVLGIFPGPLQRFRWTSERPTSFRNNGSSPRSLKHIQLVFRKIPNLSQMPFMAEILNLCPICIISHVNWLSYCRRVETGGQLTN